MSSNFLGEGGDLSSFHAEFKMMSIFVYTEVVEALLTMN